jgi:UDP-N-acetylglucosamine 2-epimerase (non-hydrolysing)
MVSEPSGIKNLQQEGFDSSKYIMVGNIMIECLLRTRKYWENITLPVAIEAAYSQKPIVATFHRPENVDDRKTLQRLVDIILGFAANHPLVFPVHPRTKSKLEQYDLLQHLQLQKNILITAPLSYFEFLKLVAGSKLVITDSGGVQEETSFLNIPCVTFRKNTERPVTVELGTNIMMSIWEENYLQTINTHLQHIESRKPVSIPLWDNEVSLRIVNFIKTKI